MWSDDDINTELRRLGIIMRLPDGTPVLALNTPDASVLLRRMRGDFAHEADRVVKWETGRELALNAVDREAEKL